MKNNIILTALPESVEIGGKQYTIRYGFREWMQWDSIIDGSGSEVEKIEKLPHTAGEWETTDGESGRGD